VSAPRPDHLRLAAEQIRAGALRGAIDRTLLAHGVDDPMLADVLRVIVTPAEQLCAERIELRAAEIERLREGS